MIVPTREKDFVCPDFVVHVKGETGNERVMKAQAAYDGAIAARGMQSLWDFGNGPELSSEVHAPVSARGSSTGDIGDRPDGLMHTHEGVKYARVARTIACTWAFTALKMYAIHCEEHSGIDDQTLSGNSRSKLPKYVPSFIGSWIMTDEEERFREGLRAYRNGLDWAKSQRDEVISRANKRLRTEESTQRRCEWNGSAEVGGVPSSIFTRRAPEAGDLFYLQQICDEYKALIRIAH